MRNGCRVNIFHIFPAFEINAEEMKFRRNVHLIMELLCRTSDREHVKCRLGSIGRKGNERGKKELA